MNEHQNTDATQNKISDVRPASKGPSFQPPMRKKRDPFLLELFKFAFIAVVIVLPIRIFIAQPFIVSGASMEPTFTHGEYLIVDELSYRFSEPSRGDVIIFRFPQDPSKFFIKRIVGLPGEEVSMQEGDVTITKTGSSDSLTLSEPYIAKATRDHFDITLDDNEYFVLGDNRPASSDSRVWGPLDGELIVGRALLRLLPVARADVLPGGYNQAE